MKLDESTAAPLQKKDRNFRATFQAYRQRKLIVKITANWDSVLEESLDINDKFKQ